MSKTFATADDLIRDLFRNHNKADLIEVIVAQNTAAVARESEAENLVRRWRDASLEGDAADLVDLTNETTDFLDGGYSGSIPTPGEPQ